MAPAVYRAALRQARRPPTSQFARFASSPAGRPARRRGGRILGLVTVAVASGAAVWAYPLVFGGADSNGSKGPVAPKAGLEFEKPRTAPASKQDSRELLSSQQPQVRKSWGSPGVYAWGSNAGRVAAPDSPDAFVKTPKRIPYFDGQLLRDLKLDKEFGVAVTERGDIVQWGAGFSPAATKPVPTLTGKDIVRVAISRDSILALSSSGAAYALPVSQADQQAGEKLRESSWLPFWSSPPPSRVSFRRAEPAGLGWFERVVDVSSGLEHCLMLTSSGRVFSAASSTGAYPSRGQLGIAGLAWATRPTDAFYEPHEVTALRGCKITKIATGDYHSLALDRDGQLFTFGDNASGQLGFAAGPGQPFIDVPSLLPVDELYSGTGLAAPRVTSIAAGGANSFFTVDATRTAAAPSAGGLGLALPAGRVEAETWAAGEGLYGSLGTGKWTHVSASPTKVKALSNLSEYDGRTHKTRPIRLARLSVGSTHASAVMGNASGSGADWGADVVFWGGQRGLPAGDVAAEQRQRADAHQAARRRRGEGPRRGGATAPALAAADGAPGRGRQRAQGQHGAEGRVRAVRDCRVFRHLKRGEGGDLV